MLPPTRDKEKRNLQILKKKTNHKHGQTAGLARPGGFLQSPTQKAEARGREVWGQRGYKKDSTWRQFLHSKTTWKSPFIWGQNSNLALLANFKLSFFL